MQELWTEDHDNDIREELGGRGSVGDSPGGWSQDATKGCQGGELRLVSRQFLCCDCASGRLAFDPHEFGFPVPSDNDTADGNETGSRGEARKEGLAHDMKIM